MRRFSALLSVFVMLMLSGCASEEPPEIVLDFTAQVSIDKACFDDEFSLELQLISTQQGAVNLRITTPDELSAISYKWSDKFELSWNDLCCQTEVGYLPRTSFAEALYCVLWDLSRNGVCTNLKDDAATFEGSCECGEYTVSTDRDGYVQNIYLEAINLSADFSY